MSELGDAPTAPEFDKSLPTVIYWHGWLEKGTVDLSTTAIRGAFMDVGGYNVITADWSAFSRKLDYYWTVRPEMKIVSSSNTVANLQCIHVSLFSCFQIAETFAKYLVEFFRVQNTTAPLILVGHSLG